MSLIGTYVRTPDGVGYVFGKSRNQFEIALVHVMKKLRIRQAS